MPSRDGCPHPHRSESPAAGAERWPGDGRSMSEPRRIVQNMTEAVVEHLAPLAEALDGVGVRWLAALGGMHPSAVVDDDVDAMSDADLMAVNEALAAVGRRYQVLHAHIANGISKRSAPARGSDGLARKAGYRSPEKLIAAATGGHVAEARRLIQVGDATAGRMRFDGERAPARHPHVAAALDSDRISTDAAHAIAALLDKVACRAERAALEQAEQTLVEQAAGLSLCDLQVILRHAEAWLDPDGVAPKIADLRMKRYLKVWEDQNGMIVLDGRLDPATGAPVKAAIEALVTAQIRAARGHNEPLGSAAGDGTGGGESSWAWTSATADAGAAGGPGALCDEAGATGSSGGILADGLGEFAERRTVPQLQTDALAALCTHALGCEQTDLPLARTTVVVRIPLEALTTGTGVATIDGIAQPIDAGTARQMAADAEIIPLVLGANSEVLDCGRARRLFTRAQRLALAERDGGCAGCGAPPGMTEAHHLVWWSYGGTTDLSNGILLCTSCHHTIHAGDWEIRIDGADVWFIPPAHIDPARTARCGRRRRFQYGRAA